MNNKASGENSAVHYHKQSLCSSRGGKTTGNNISLIHKISWVTLRAGALCTVHCSTHESAYSLNCNNLPLPIKHTSGLHSGLQLHEQGGCIKYVSPNYVHPAEQRPKHSPEPSREAAFKKSRPKSVIAGCYTLGLGLFSKPVPKKIWAIRSRSARGVGAGRKYLSVKMWLWGNAWDW